MSSDSHSNTPAKRTPLYDRHLAAGARMVNFGGWEMPLHYGSQLEEHHATRRSVTLFDVSHMGQVLFTGPGAEALVQRITTRDVAPLGDGEEAYGLLCNESGGMIDDLFVARLGRDEILLVVNAATYEGDVAAMERIASDAQIDGATMIPCSEAWAMIAVQGPQWREACRAALGGGAWEQLPRNRIVRLSYNETPLLLSTTGYTGEEGCELLCAPEVAPQLWDALVAAGGRPAGLAARDSLRLEYGFLLSGQDFTIANNPFETRVTWATQLTKENFSGIAALRAIKASGGPRQRLVGLLAEGKRIPRHGAAILADGKQIGEVTSGSFSPTLDRPIAMGYVALPHDAFGGHVQIDLGRGSTVDAEVVKPPFVKTDKQGRDENGKAKA